MFVNQKRWNRSSNFKKKYFLKLIIFYLKPSLANKILLLTCRMFGTCLFLETWTVLWARKSIKVSSSISLYCTVRSKTRKKSIFWERACNPKSQILTIFSTFFKSQKWSAQNEAIFGGQNQKNAKNFFKNFYCPKSSEISYRSIIYL